MFSKCLFFLYLRAFLHFSSVFLSRGQRGQKRAEGTKICPFSAFFAVLTPILCSSSLSPLSASRPVNAPSFLFSRKKSRPWKPAGGKMGSRKRQDGFLPVKTAWDAREASEKAHYEAIFPAGYSARHHSCCLLSGMINARIWNFRTDGP